MSRFKIQDVIARKVFDSRAFPTVEVEMVLTDGTRGRAVVPAGASTGKFEALELRDGDPRHFGGRGIDKALENIRRELAPGLIGQDVRRQTELDQWMIELDGTKNKQRLGANAILGCSMALCHTAANAYQMPLYQYLGGAQARTIPVPMIQIIGGGAHAGGVIDVQDFLVIPTRAATFAEGLEMVVETYLAAKRLFEQSGRPISVAEEGGLWPTAFSKNEDGLELLTASIREAGFVPGKDLAIALDIASSEFYDATTGLYTFKLEDKSYTSSEFIDLICDWVARYPIISIEDGCSELDWQGSIELTKRLGDRIQLIGDDLFTTNLDRIRQGIEQKALNAVLIKLNQIGTITETLQAIELSKTHRYNPVISARSGETADVTISHLAVATNAGQLKVGSVTRSERLAKWNEVLRIEEQLGAGATYPSGALFGV